ncbi:hypothetical protein B0J11DRAFT_316210 [Dendryphion nanum]|uniref:Uncharacterized protein n=1 Tax=Dendryphion nanum TaxID=256645 RepID=A0A9P9DQU6_9PLEO|nr:hypothetical protein B0J11DRAFT_316210 [Dendryphion nanum]
MSDITTSPAPQFTERELLLLGFAMQSLKSGPPEIDYEKLAAKAGMSNPRSASNAWAKIKAKLMAGADNTDAPATPKKSRAKGKKNVTTTKTNGDGSEGDDVETPKKTPAKRKAKKQDGDEGGSPKKKSRTPAKKEEQAKTTVKEDINNQADDERESVGVETETELPDAASESLVPEFV